MNDKKEKILFVDDDNNILEAYRRQLGRKYQVYTALNGESGLLALEHYAPVAVVVADYKMPDMDGIQMLSIARQIEPDTVRIMLTGFADLQVAMAALNKGSIFRFLTKPCAAPDLLKAIEDGIDRYKETSSQKELFESALQKINADNYEVKRMEAELQKMVMQCENTIEGTIQSLSLIVEKKDLYTAGHQKNVARLSSSLAYKMNLSAEEIKGLVVAALIHDIGKICVPAEILNKPGPLSEMEFNILKEHPRIGFEILERVEFPWPVAQTILQHHERLNGSGYPQGHKEKDILLTARILAVADVVEAISSHRPYRPALGQEKALEEISVNKGVLYDKEVVEACLKIIGTPY